MRLEPTPSWVLFFGATGVGFGIALASWFWGPWMWVLAAFGTIIFAFVVRLWPSHRRAMMVGVWIVAMMIGVGRYALAGPGAHSIAHAVGRDAIVSGRIVKIDENDASTVFVLDSLLIDGVRFANRLQVRAPMTADGQLGEYVRLACALGSPEPFDGFRYDRFLAARSIYAVCDTTTAPLVLEHPSSSMSDMFWTTIGRWHKTTTAIARNMLPEPHATLLLGLLFGEDDFSGAWSERFQRTGVSHIVAASGYNVAVVSELALLFLVTLGLYRKQAYPIVVSAIVLFVVFAGAGGAVVRAGVMGVLALSARTIGRRASMRNLLALTIVLMLLVEPRLLRDDVGFQLSVAATIGLVLLSQKMEHLLRRLPSAFGVRESLGSTLAATIATLPVTIVAFGKVSIVAPVVNTLVLPFIPYAMAFGGVGMMVTALWQQSGPMLGLPAWTVLSTMLRVIRAFSSLSFAAFSVSTLGGVGIAVLALFAAIALGVFLPRAFERQLDAWSLRQMSIIFGVLVLLFAGNVGMIAIASDRFDGGVHVFVFDVGQGDGMMIASASSTIIIDGGPTRQGLVEAMADVRFPWERRVDVVLATHPHIDHVNGLFALVETATIDDVVKNGSHYQTPSTEKFAALWPNAVVASSARSWEIGENARLEILWPENETDNVNADNVHERSIVARLTVGEETMLFTGDAEADVETALGDVGHVDVLKVGHHGSDTSTSQAFLDDVMPSFAVISVGRENVYHHPSPFTLARLVDGGVQVFRTDELGTIRCDFDGESVVCGALPWWE